MKRYLKKADFEKKIEERLFLVKGDKIFLLNEAGTIIWEILDELPSEEHIKKFISQYMKEKTKVKSDIEKKIFSFIKELKKNKLIEEVEK
ncbi:hypothetical protein HRbin19_00902 [bacterium HR19]|nr:hypothetical protein HRbin19_00902 [bacterium HR19]